MSERDLQLYINQHLWSDRSSTPRHQSVKEEKKNNKPFRDINDHIRISIWGLNNKYSHNFHSHLFSFFFTLKNTMSVMLCQKQLLIFTSSLLSLTVTELVIWLMLIQLWTIKNMWPPKPPSSAPKERSWDTKATAFKTATKFCSIYNSYFSHIMM